MFSIVIIVAILLVLLCGTGIILGRLYRRATPSQAFVRNGVGGKKVVLNGGAIVLPIFHTITPVNLATLRLDVSRTGPAALITADKIRADVKVEFYMNVPANADSVSIAAQTLGDLTMDVKALADLIQGKFIDALRAVAASKTLDDLQKNRLSFIEQVESTIKDGLGRNGLQLEHASMIDFDQTKMEHFDPDNAFDAEGRATVARIVSEQNKRRNQVLRETEVSIAQQDLESETQRLDLAKKTVEAKVKQEQEVANLTAASRANVAQQEAEASKNERIAKLKADREVAEIDAASREAQQTARITADQNIALAQQKSQIAVADASRDLSESETKAQAAKADATKAEEGVTTAREVAIAERQRSIRVIEATQAAESTAVSVTVQAEAEQRAAASRASAVITEAEADASAIKLRAAAQAVQYDVDSEGQRKLNEARNTVSHEIIARDIDVARFEMIPRALAEIVKPLNNIGTVSIVDTAGFHGASGGDRGDGATGGDGGPMDQLVNSLLRYMIQKPVISHILQDAGFTDKGDVISTIASAMRRETTPVVVPQSSPIEGEDPERDDDPALV